MPNASCSEPSRAHAIAQTFSVHERSDWATVANVSVIWWWNDSSAGISGPSVGTARSVPPELVGAHAAQAEPRHLREPTREAVRVVLAFVVHHATAGGLGHADHR